MRRGLCWEGLGIRSAELGLGMDRAALLDGIHMCLHIGVSGRYKWSICSLLEALIELYSRILSDV